MGDNGKMYVPKELKEIYKKEILPLADVLTPNQFELELLTDHKVTNLTELQNAIKKLHEIGPQTIAVSSTDFSDKLTALVSTMKDNTLVKIDIPKIPATFTGSGDLFAALFLAHAYLESDMKTTMEKTINSLYSVLLKTYECFKDVKAQPARKIELRLVESKNSIENPEICLFAEVL